MTDRAYIVSRTLETKIAMAENNGNNALIVTLDVLKEILVSLKEQDELLKHEYWRGYNNGRTDERGLQEGTIMQTFSPD